MTPAAGQRSLLAGREAYSPDAVRLPVGWNANSASFPEPEVSSFPITC